MFVLLLLVNLGVAFLATILVILAFRGPITSILARIVQGPVAAAWHRFLVFALLVVGISSGVSPWSLERYLKTRPSMPGESPPPPLVLDAENWALEVYRTASATLQGLGWGLFVFFGIGLIMSAIFRAAEERAGARMGAATRPLQEPPRGREMVGSRGGRERMPEPRRRPPMDPRRRGGEGRPREEPLRGPAGDRGTGVDRESRGGESRGGERGSEGRSGER